jgi:hypothetical protein
MAGAHGDVVMTYAAGDLQHGATQQATAADAADGLARMLVGVQLDPAALGTVRSAAAFAQAIGVAQRSQARGAAGEARRRVTIGRNSSTTADLGDGLTADSTQVAQVGPIATPR